MPEPEAYPASASGRDRFIVERRGPSVPHDPWRHQGVLVEDERTADGTAARDRDRVPDGTRVPVAVRDVRSVEIHHRHRHACRRDRQRRSRSRARCVQDRRVPVSGMKLYNAGSFFDPRAVPDADYDGVAEALAGLSRVIVESHPALIGPRVDRLLGSLARRRSSDGPAIQLEVAMGLETAHPEALDRLNKRFTLEQFARAAAIARGARSGAACVPADRAAIRRRRASRTHGCWRPSTRPWRAARRSSRWFRHGRATARWRRWRQWARSPLPIWTRSSAASRSR